MEDIKKNSREIEQKIIAKLVNHRHLGCLCNEFVCQVCKGITGNCRRFRGKFPTFCDKCGEDFSRYLSEITELQKAGKEIFENPKSE